MRQGGVASHVVFTVYMDELILELKRSGIRCHIGHKYYGSLGYDDDLKLLCPSIESRQKMMNICAQFGNRFDVQYNAKKSFCIALSRAVDLSNCLNENNRFYLNGSIIEWKKSVKDLGNHVNYNLSESEEIRHKSGEFIGRVNGLLVQYGDAQPEVQMYLLSAYWDAIFRRFYKMYEYMCSNKNETMSFLTAMSMLDYRNIIARNIKFICDKRRVEPQSLQYRWNMYVVCFYFLYSGRYVIHFPVKYLQ